MERLCELEGCENITTNPRFCREACRSKWKYHNIPGYRDKKQAVAKEYNDSEQGIALRRKRLKNRYHSDAEYREKELARNRALYHSSPELMQASKFRLIEWSAEWSKTPEGRTSARISRHNRRTLIKDGGNFTADEWINLCSEYNFQCANCKKSEQTIDHILPISLNGSNTIDNIQPLCQSCNSKKGIRVIDYRKT